MKPIPASTCWQCVATVRAVRPAVAFASAAVSGIGFVAGRAERRVERLDRDERLGEPVANGLERARSAGRTAPAPARGRARARASLGVAPGDLVRDRAPAERDAPTSHAARRAASPARRRASTRHDVEAGVGIDAAHRRHVDGRDRHGRRVELPDPGVAHDQQLRGGRDARGREPERVHAGRRRRDRAGPTCRTAGAARRDRRGAAARAPTTTTSSSADRGAVRRAERVEHDRDRVARLGLEHLEPAEIGEHARRARSCPRRPRSRRGRSASSSARSAASITRRAPRSRRRRAMMLRCTSAVPP